MKLIKVNVMYVDVNAIVSDITEKVNYLGYIASVANNVNLSADIIGTLCAINDNLSEIIKKINNK